MTHSSTPDPVQLNNDESLRILARALTLSQGNFSLTLARCDYRHLQQAMIDQLQQLCPFDIRWLTLTTSTDTLYSAIVEELGDEHPAALMVFGLEQVQDLAKVLNATNQVREEFRKHFDFPVVLWVDSRVQQALIRSAPDFESWSTTVAFDIQSEEVRRFLTAETDRIFDTLLEVGAGLFLDNHALQIHPGSPLLSELERGQALLRERGIKIGPDLDGSVEFVLGRAKVADEPASKAHYDRSIEQFRSNDTPDTKDRLGCVWHYLGVWWRTYSVQHRAEYHESCVQARSCFQAAIAAFESAQRDDLVARFTEKLGEVLQRMQDWDGLKELVQKRLRLHESYPDLFRESRTYGFRAEIALAKATRLAQPEDDGKTLPKAKAEAQEKPLQETLTQAKEWAEQAIQLLQDASETETIPAAFERETFLDWHHCFLKGWYCFALGRAYKGLGQTDQAIQTLEMAKDEVNESYDPPLYIDILKALRELYFEQEDYLKAFDTRQAYRSIQQQYGYRAFVGAGRLQAKKAIANPSLAHVETVGQVSTEIARSGRQRDVERLIGRLQRSDQKLIVLHGQSGVGKSSIIQAGLIPALTPLTFEGREVAVVLQQVYTPWDKRLGNRLLETLRGLEHRATDEALESSEAILQKIEQTVNQNFMAVLILDQFEEFFFVYKDPTDRKLFYQFLRDCLAIPYVKVVLSLREDYLHYLLECNDRLVTLNIINNNILDKDILYYLGNFSPDDAKSVIEGLTHQSQFALETDLIDSLVKDLAQELGEVRPIELQVVGNQLQTEDITTLEGYAEKGPKEALVGRFLEEIVQDCGPDNEQIAKLVLYLLTDENNTRPLKTRADLELELDVESSKLDLILKLLVKSRLVFLIPASPSDRYQLVHDYLVPFVRQQQSARLIAEIEKEREQRKLTEAKLNTVLRQQLRTARRTTVTLAGFTLVVTGFALITAVASINTYLNLQTTASSNNLEFDRIVSALKVAKKSQRLPGLLSTTRFKALTELNQSITASNEFTYLDGHTDKINHVIFSHDGKIIASASQDKTIRLWQLDGTEIFKTDSEHGHKESVNVVSFSPDNQLIASGSDDNTIKIWRIDGTLMTTKKHRDKVNDVQFSPNGKLIISASDDKTIKIWERSQDRLILKREIKNLPEKVNIIRFSSDGTFFASSGKYDAVRLWSIEGKEIGKFESYGTTDIRFSSDSKTLNIAAKGSLKIWDHDKDLLVKNLYTRLFSAKISNPAFQSQVFASVPYSNQSAIALIGIGSNFLYREYGTHEISGEIHYLKFSLDEKYLISAAQDNIIKLRNIRNYLAKDRNEIHLARKTKYGSFIGNQSEIKSYSGDNISEDEDLLEGDLKLLAINKVEEKGLVRASPYDEIKLWSLYEGSSIYELNGNYQITHFKVSPNRKHFLLVDNQGELRLLDINGKELKLESSGLKRNKKIKIDLIKFSPDNEQIIAIKQDKIYFWDINGVFQGSVIAHDRKVTNVFFTPDSKKIISIGDDNLIKIWNRDATLYKYLIGHESPAQDISFSPDGKLMMSQSSSYFSTDIYLWGKDAWDTKSNVPYRKITTGFEGEDFKFSPDSSFLLSKDSHQAMELWNLQSIDSSSISLEGHIGKVNKTVFSPDSKVIVSAGEDNTIRLWDRNGVLMDLTSIHDDSVLDLSLSSDGQRLVSIGLDQKIRIHDISDGKLDQIRVLPLKDLEVDLERIQEVNVRLMENGKFVACWFLLRSDKPDILMQQQNFNYIFKLFSIDGEEIVDIDGNKQIKNRHGSFSRKVVGINDAFDMSEDFKSFAFIDRRDEIEILDLNGKLSIKLKGHTDWINSIDIDLKNQKIVSASDDKTIKLWDIDGSLIKEIVGHDKGINSISFSPDGQKIVSGSDDKTIKLWDLNGQELETVTTHTDKVLSVRFSPSGNLIASASSDNTVQLWNANLTLKGNPFREENISSVDALSFSKDGKTLSRGHGEENLQLYFLGSESIWIKETEISPIRTVEDLNLNGDRPLETIAVDDGLEIVALGLEATIEKACNRVRGYLKNSSRVDEKDRTLCDGIGDEDFE